MGCIASKFEEGALFSAIKTGNVAEARKLIESSQTPLDQILDNKRQTLLHKAAKHAQPECVETLLSMGSRSSVARDQNDQTPLHAMVAELSKHPGRSVQANQVLKAMLKHTPAAQLDVHDQDSTPLLLAVSLKLDSLVQAFLDGKFNPAAITRSEGCNALHLAIRARCFGVIPALLKAAQGMRAVPQLVNQQMRDGSTALHLAVAAELQDAVQQLLQVQFIDLNLKDGQRNTPLHLILLCMVSKSITRSMIAIAKDLLAAGAAIDLPNAAGQTAISLAVDSAQRACMEGAAPGVVDVLLAMAQGQGKIAPSSTAFNMIATRGAAAVHVAAVLGRVDLLIGLQTRGANMDLQDGEGRLPTVLAAQAGHKHALVTMFGQLKADPLAMDRTGTSAVGYLLLNPNPRFNATQVMEVIAAVIRAASADGPDRLAKQPVTATGLQALRGAHPLLHLACATGNLEVVELVLVQGHVPVDAPGSQGFTPLGLAVTAYNKGGQNAKLLAVVDFLIKQGASPIVKDNTGGTPLGKAIDAGHLDLAMTMLRGARSCVDHAAPSGATALYLAIVQGNTACAQKLIVQFGASTGAQRSHIPLHVAVGMRNIPIIELLLNTEQGQKTVALNDVSNMPVLGYLWNPWNPSALHPAHVPQASALDGGKSGSLHSQPSSDDSILLELVKPLLRSPNCDVNAMDTKGRRPLHWAVYLNNLDLVKVLSTSGRNLNPNLADADGITPLFLAVQKGNLHLLQTMLDYLKDLDLSVTSRVLGVESGRTALQAAVATGNVQLATAILSRPDVSLDMRTFVLCMQHIESKPTQCCTIMAELLHHSRTSRCLINLAGGFSALMAATVHGERLEFPPLHMAAMHDQPDLVRMLVRQAGAAVDEKDSKGWTPLHHAVSRKSYRAATELVELGAAISALADGGTTPLIAAAAALDDKMVNLLLSTKVPFDVNATDNAGHTALTTAIQALLTPANNSFSKQSVNGRAPDSRGQLDQNSKGNLATVSRSSLEAGSWSNGANGSGSHHAHKVSDDGNNGLLRNANFKLDPMTSQPSRPLDSFASNDLNRFGNSSMLSAASGFPSSVMTPADSMALIQQISCVAAPEDCLAIFYSLVQCGADVNQPLPSNMKAAAVPSGLPPTPAKSGILTSTPSIPTPDNSEVMTPLLAAICMRAVPVVEILLCVPNLDINGTKSTPALLTAIQCVQALGTEDMSGQPNGAGKPGVPGAPPVRGQPSKFQSFFGKGRQMANRTPLQGPATPAEIRQQAARILRMIAADPRTDLMQSRSGSDLGSSGLLAQLVLIGGNDVTELVRVRSPCMIHVLNATMNAERIVVRDLISSGRSVDINASDPTTGQTVLHLAAAKADYQMVAELAAAPGIDFNILDKQGHTPLACAVIAGSADTIRTLLSAGRSNLQARTVLSPTCCSPNPATSPMALALTQPDTKALDALVYGAQAANDLVVASSATALPSSMALLASVTRRGADPNKSPETSQVPGSKYDMTDLLESPIDSNGRTAVLWAVLKLKLHHALTLVQAGARVDVREEGEVAPSPAPLANLASNHHFASPSMGGSQLQRAASGVDGHTPLSLLFQYIIELSATQGKEKEKRLSTALDLASLMAKHDSVDNVLPLQDGIGFTVLHWAVLTKQKRLVELLCPRAQRLKCTDTRADTQRGLGVTALHLAAQLGLVEIAQALIVVGHASLDIVNNEGLTPLLASKSEPMQLMLSDPPAKMAPGDASKAVILKRKNFFGGTVEGAKNQMVTTWKDVVGLDPLNKKATEDPSKFVQGKPDGTVVVDNPHDLARGRMASNALYGAFRTAVKAGARAGEGLGAVGVVLSVICTVADQLMDGLEHVVMNNIIVAHVCGRIRLQLPMLQALKKACESRKDDGQTFTIREQLLPHIESLGELYITVHQKVDEWSVTGKVSLISRMLTSQDFYRDFKDLELMLTARMTDLGVAINVSKILEGTNQASIPTPPVETPADVEMQVRDAIKADMQLAMRDILETEAMGADMQVNKNKAVKMFKDHGLDYNKLKKAERKRWAHNKIRDLSIPYSELEIVHEVGVGGTAHVFLAKWQGHPVAFKRFDALPQAGEQLKEAVENEAFIMSTLRHPNILQLYGIVCESKDKGGETTFGLVVDYHSEGSLQEMMDVRKGGEPLSILQRVAIALQIARGMAYLHGRSFEPIVHGDLKPSNVLVSADGRAVITDFGLARICSNTTTTAAPAHGDSFTSNASAVYTAPEVMQQLLDNIKRQPQGDVFAFGVLMLELMTLSPAQTGFAATSKEYTDKVARGERPTVPQDLPPIIRLCIQQCWQHKPEKRLPFRVLVDMLNEVYNSLVAA